MSSAPLQHAGEAAWATQWVEASRVSLTAAPSHERAACAARIAAVLFACGRDDEGDAVLSGARREAVRTADRAGLARIEIALADGALARDNEARAQGHLAAARRQGAPADSGIAARAWLVESRMARMEGRPPPAFVGDDPDATLEDVTHAGERIDVGAELALERAIGSRLAKDWVATRTHLEKARELAKLAGSPRLVATVEIEIGMYTAEVDDPSAGYARIRHAIDVLGACGLRRDEGRAMIRLAEMIAARAVESEHDSAALWLGRAQTALGPSATWRDRSSIRTGFNVHGRRLYDRVMTEETASRIEAFERARGSLLAAIALSVESAECAMNDLEAHTVTSQTGNAMQGLVERARAASLATSASTSPALGELDKVVHDLIDLIGAALVERDRLRTLLNALSDIDASTDRDALPSLVAEVAARILEADHVVVALARDGALEPVGRWGEGALGSSDLWRSAANAAVGKARSRGSESPLARRADAQLAGPVLVVPMRASDVVGVIYADKLARKGQFREQDHALAFLLAEYSAIALGRLRAREHERHALKRLAVTLDAIRDGVLAWDDHAVILSTNVALDRMLRVGHEELVGQRIDQVPALAPLWALVAVSQRLEGAVVRMTSGSFVVSTRPLTGEGEAPTSGMVATLVELDRAHKLAQRIGATRPRYGFHDVIGESPALLHAIAIAKRAAAGDATVLITGESGTGKEIIAQAIHTAGARASEPFVGINVAALPRELLEAELFGYERGAFTGARSEGNLGKFELAGNGTILLDEIGEMPLDMQAKLLRVLQERLVVRLGGSSERAVHARVMATTHRDLQQLVDEGKFRMDLLYRLRVLSVELPPLRERREDITILAQHHLSRFAEQQRKRVRELGPRVFDELLDYDWPGNIRELANIIEAEVSLLAADVTVLDRLATRLVGRFRASIHPGTTGELRAVEAPLFAPTSPVVPLAELEKRAYLHALDKHNQSVARAAEALGVSKVTFYAKLRTWGLHPRDKFDEESPTSVRRQRAVDPFRRSDGFQKAAEPFEPPTRTSKIPTRDDE